MTTVFIPSSSCLSVFIFPSLFWVSTNPHISAWFYTAQIPSVWPQAPKFFCGSVWCSDVVVLLLLPDHLSPASCPFTFSIFLSSDSFSVLCVWCVPNLTHCFDVFFSLLRESAKSSHPSWTYSFLQFFRTLPAVFCTLYESFPFIFWLRHTCAVLHWRSKAPGCSPVLSGGY